MLRQHSSRVAWDPTEKKGHRRSPYVPDLTAYPKHMGHMQGGGNWGRPIKAEEAAL